MRLYVVHIQSRSEERVVCISDIFDNAEDARVWGRGETADDPDLTYRLQEVGEIRVVRYEDDERLSIHDAYWPESTATTTEDRNPSIESSRS